MDAPQGRYRVEERDGRLVVIDNLTGAPATSVTPPRPGSPSPVSAGRGMADSLADALVALATKGRDDQGRAIVAWEWTESGKTRRWDARLDPGQQRRLGRALLALGGFPLGVIVVLLAGAAWGWIGLALAFAFGVRGLLHIRRLQAETGGTGA
jgi:hypothetical protein